MAESKNTLAAAAKEYIGDTLGQQLIGRLQPWKGAKALPFYLQERYQAYSLKLSNTPVLMLCLETSEKMKPGTPAAIAKHVQVYRKAFDGEVFVVLDRIKSYNRKRLIDQRVPFVVPQKQLYLPQFGTVFSERYKQPGKPPAEQLSPVAQVLLLRHLLGLYPEPMSALVLAEQLGYTKMTLGRVINELVGLQLAETLPVGREKRLVFEGSGKKLWQRCFSYLMSPVQKTVMVKRADAEKLLKNSQAFVAGESALSEKSMLTEPETPVIAMAAKQWKNPYGTNDNLFFEDDWALQLWRYDPALLTVKNKTKPQAPRCVDNLSLDLSLNEEVDERVRMALDELLEATLQGS